MCWGPTLRAVRTRTIQARRVTAASWRLGRHDLGLRVGDELAVAHRRVCDGEFEDAVEEHAAAAGSASVEPKDELIEVALQMRVLDRALVRAQQPALRQGAIRCTAGSNCPGSSPPAR